MTLDPKRLWAKSGKAGETPRPSMCLLGHLKDAVAAAERIVEATGVSQLSALGLNAPAHFERFRRCVLLAAALHDLGKANDHFQAMILFAPARRDKPQGLRHEWVTVLMLQGLRAWLLPAVGGSEDDFALVEWAIAGHHPAYDRASPPRSCPPGAGAEIRLLTDHKDFAGVLRWLGERFLNGSPAPVVPAALTPLVGGGNAFARLATWAKDANTLWDKLRKSPDAKLLAALRNCLVAADIAGSALPGEVVDETTRWQSLSDAFGKVPDPADLQFLADYGLEGCEPRAFQNQVAEHPDDVVFVKAGCGSGKTVAAYMRAAKKYGGRRLYFCYPTTGTATEGFKDYLHPEVPENETDDTPKTKADRDRLRRINADLFHSRSSVDFEIILGTGGDSATPDADAASKLESLRVWSTPVVACTVDTVLGIVQNNKRGLFAWPALAQSAFVFDEIHAYDDRLFGALLRFLRDLPGLPALLMTASLPTPREEALREVLRKFRGIELTPIEGPEDFETRPRYHRLDVPGGDPLPRIVVEVKAGGKVLWVSNVVNRVMASADRATAAGLTPLIYHSRFKYEHRVRRHKAVIDAFKTDDKKGVLACTSQVCEMSLDLKGCTLLVTESATVPAIIQRLGRLNRQAEKGHPTKPFVVLEPENCLPYTPADLEAATAWLGKLPSGDLSQRHLAAAWVQTAENPPDLVASAWLDGGPRTTVTELREASPGVTVIVEGDVPHAAGKNLGKYTLPMPPPPKSANWHGWPKHRGLPVAPDDSVDYDPMRGATWRK